MNKMFLWTLPYTYGEWLPEDKPLFRPFIADPREVTFSVGWRFRDRAVTKNAIDVSYPGLFPIFRWHGVWPGNATMQFGVEGALWAVFDPDTFSAPLVNADYYVSFPLTYCYRNWSFRLRGYHISSHIGDEFLLNHPDFDRRNPSAEYLDFYVSYNFNTDLRMYGGIGWIVQQDESYDLGEWYAEAGAEIRFTRCGMASFSDQVYAIPIFAMHFSFNNRYNHHVNQTYIMGYEFGKCSGLCRRVRLFVEYHDGYSVEGQFRCIPTNYLSLRFTYGF